ncbi:MAG: autotransporter assembly complex protein TamA [Burkholderiaceae bacterium]
MITSRLSGAPLVRFVILLTVVTLVAACASTSPVSSEASPGKSPDQSASDKPVEKDALTDVVNKITGKKPPPNYQFEIKAPESLLDSIRTQTFVGRWQRRKDYSESQFEGLAAQLESEVLAILRSKGYFNGKATVTASAEKKHVSLVVRAGARTTVNQMSLDVVGPAKDDAQVLKFSLSRWALPAGSFFDTTVWQSSKRNLIEALHQQGYLRARIQSSKARVDPELTAAALSVTVDSGKRLQFGDLEIVGLERYDLLTVADLRPFTEGDPYTLDVLLLYQARLRSAGYFKDVLVLPRLDLVEKDESLIQVPIRVELTERESKRAAIGVGYSTDEGPRGQLGLEHRDLFNRNWQLESALVVSAKRQRAFANIKTPYDHNNYFNGFGGRVESEDIEGLVSSSSNTYIGRGRRIGNIETFLSLQFQTEEQKISPGSDSEGRVFSQKALVLGYSWNLRRLDSTIDPRRGYTISAQLSGARQDWLADQSFVRLYTRAIRFQPMPVGSMFEKGTLVLLGELGLVSAESREGIPSENLFRTGGAQTIRGYSYRSLGATDAGATVGGRYALLGSIEYQHRVSDLYSLATFFDYGNAVDSRKDYVPFAGYGIGARFRTPVGPVNLDLAYGHQARRLRLHFSVGYTF